MFKRLWGRLSSPAKRTSAGVLLVVGAIGGIIFWGGFNTAMEATNSMAFCTGCHEMQPVYDEYRQSVHYENDAGVRAVCADCHVPRPWVHKLVRKIKATNELYHKLAGTIDTPEKFEAERLHLARNVWGTMKGSDSRECRNCHSFEAMRVSGQGRDARLWHPTAIDEGFTCIDCHKGIAHRLPDLTPIARQASERLDAAIERGGSGFGRRVVVAEAPVSADPGGESIATLLPGAVVTSSARKDGWIRFRLDARQMRGNDTVLFADESRAAPVMALGDGTRIRASTDTFDEDPGTRLAWRAVSVDGWIEAGRLVRTRRDLWEYAGALYESACTRCHARFAPSSFTGPNWGDHLQNMRRYAPLDQEQMAVLEKYLQHHAKGLGEI